MHTRTSKATMEEMIGDGGGDTEMRGLARNAGKRWMGKRLANALAEQTDANEAG